MAKLNELSRIYPAPTTAAKVFLTSAFIAQVKIFKVSVPYSRALCLLVGSLMLSVRGLHQVEELQKRGLLLESEGEELYEVLETTLQKMQHAKDMVVIRHLATGY